jgi:hypothetical protein
MLGKEEPPAPQEIAVRFGDQFVLGTVGEKVCGGLFEFNVRVGNSEVFLGVFRLDEILDPASLTPATELR